MIAASHQPAVRRSSDPARHARRSIMTVYNDLRFLDAAVDSILQQEFRDLELIIVDDGTGQDAMFAALGIVIRASGSCQSGQCRHSAAANRGIEMAERHHRAPRCG